MEGWELIIETIKNKRDGARSTLLSSRVKVACTKAAIEIYRNHSETHPAEDGCSTSVRDLQLASEQDLAEVLRWENALTLVQEAAESEPKFVVDLR